MTTTDNPQKAIREAEAWLASAKHTLVDAQSDEALAGVCCAQAIHGIIRANDALALKFLGTKPTRHDDLATTFAKLVRQNKLAKADGRFKGLLAKAVMDKSGADYGKKTFSYEEAGEYVEKAEEFIATAKKHAE